MNCPICDRDKGQWDDIAIHLVNAHGWDYEVARLWLRGKVEAEAYLKEP